ncbi:MAG: hydroxyethylthiazole kinase [Schaedlerella sp.]|nr:hydroxyethylthiazole kinase [Schaedlerella sp.]
MFKKMLENVRNNCPLIHNITNYVTVNDCANIVIACGAAPIMSDDKEEVEEITTICSGLNINIGTLNNRTIDSMLIAGKRANKLNHPIVLDPVGAGASRLRREAAMKLLEEVKFAVIRGNISEIKTLASGNGTTKGVDADDKTAYCIYNGHPMMSSITGTGCQLSAMTAGFVTANPEHLLEAASASVAAMGLAGEIAYQRLTKRDGNSSYRNYIIDAIYNMTPEQLEKGTKYEVR